MQFNVEIFHYPFQYFITPFPSTSALSTNVARLQLQDEKHGTSFPRQSAQCLARKASPQKKSGTPTKAPKSGNKNIAVTVVQKKKGSNLANLVFYKKELKLGEDTQNP